MNLLKMSNINNFVFINQKKNLICILIIVLSFLFDRISKIKIINYQLNNNPIYINDFINLDLVWNIGIGFGLFSSNSNLIYNSLTVIIGGVIIFLIYLIANQHSLIKYYFH